MSDNLIGGQITRYRKALGMTQEELGRAVGVSTQAVSRWECGGAPDVTLLPAIADRLHITVDTLFGREGGTPVDIQTVVLQWLLSLPDGQRMNRLCRLLWELSKNVGNRRVDLPNIGYLKHCEMESISDNDRALLRTYVDMDQGMMLGVGAEDMSFMSIYPEPPAGYRAFFSDSEVYRRLFAALARPHGLELLYGMYEEKKRFYTAGAVARSLEITGEEASELLEAMEAANLLSKQELELESGVVSTYMRHNYGALVPFLYLARWVSEHNDSYHLTWQERRTPLLRRDAGEKQPAKEN